MNRFLKSFFLTILIIVLVLPSLTSCVTFDIGEGSEDIGAVKDKSKFGVLEEIFDSYSYYDLDEEKMLEEALKAYADASGDKYAIYYTEEEFNELTAEKNGNMQGIGVTVIYDNDNFYLEIINVMPESPASKAGVLPNDRIVAVKIDGEYVTVEELGYGKAMSAMKGTAGTMLSIRVCRGDEQSEELEFSIIRGYVTTQSVMYHVCETDNTVGIVKIMQFDLTTPEQFKNSVNALIEQGINKIVFDLRYNGGGDLKSVVAVLSCFVDEGDVLLSTKTKASEEQIIKASVATYFGDYSNCSVKRSDIGIYKNIEAAVLVNSKTASAAELFAAVFRDYKIAPIVGTLTYGKGSMQSVISLEQYGYEGGIRLTSKMYFPPCGESYNGIGIEPDISIELAPELENINIYKITDAQDNQLQKAISTFYND